MVIILLFKRFRSDFLGARWDGEVVREMMDEAFANKHKVTLDFKKIKLISHSFADEIVGIYARAFGTDFIKQNIEVVNANKDVKFMLNAAIRLSIKYGQKLTTSKEVSDGNNNQIE